MFFKKLILIDTARAFGKHRNESKVFLLPLGPPDHHDPPAAVSLCGFRIHSAISKLRERDGEIHGAVLSPADIVLLADDRLRRAREKRLPDSQRIPGIS